MLKNYPKTHAFIALASSEIKGESFEFWMNELQDYSIGTKCLCGECYTFALTPPKGHGPFTDEAMISFFGDTSVILHSDKNGRLSEVELPEITDIPFADEYSAFDQEDYICAESTDECNTMVKKWFENHSI
jgi:hypothetical protein